MRRVATSPEERRPFGNSLRGQPCSVGDRPPCQVRSEICPDRARGDTLARPPRMGVDDEYRSEEHTSELQSLRHLVCRLLLEKKTKHDTNRTSRSLPRRTCTSVRPRQTT